MAPLYGEKMTWTETSPSGQQIQHTDRGTMTLLDANGPRVLIPLAIPLVLSALPLFFSAPHARRRAGLICGVLLAIVCVLGSFTIGLYYPPSAFALLLAAVLTRPPAPSQ